MRGGRQTRRMDARRCEAHDKPDEWMHDDAKFMTNQTSGWENHDKPDEWMGKS